MSDKAIEKNQSWVIPPRKSGGLKPGLYIVATPIGNLGDVTMRALDTLAAADVVACEDTRVSGKLLSHFGLKKTLLPYNDHSDDKQRMALIKKLQDGLVVALISDAGMPLISDPGYKLVRDCVAAHIYVTSLPGANAPLAALQLSGLPSDQFCFLGFLPAKTTARQKMLRDWAGVQASLIVFESAGRLVKSLADIQAVLGDRQIAVVREITKMYEQARRGNVSALLEFYESEGAPKGEIVIVIEPAGEVRMGERDIEAALRRALKTMSTKEAAAHVAEISGQPRKALYNLALGFGKDE